MTTEKKHPTPESPAEFLRALYLERKERNPAYSTRAFARDLGMSQTLVSFVMNGKRPLSAKQAAQISVLLEFSQERAQEFIETTLLALPEHSKAARRLRSQRDKRGAAQGSFVGYELDRFKTLSHWYHLAILDLATTHDFRESATWVARRLGISAVEARDALSRLEKLGLLERDAGTRRVRKADRKFYFATQRSEPAVRNHHKQMIAKATDQLDRVDDAAFAAREISSITMAVPASKMSEARARVHAFQKELSSWMIEPTPEHPRIDEVYQLNVQLFPLTKKVSPT